MKGAFKLLALGAALAVSATMAKASEITGGVNLTGDVTFNGNANPDTDTRGTTVTRESRLSGRTILHLKSFYQSGRLNSISEYGQWILAVRLRERQTFKC